MPLVNLLICPDLTSIFINHDRDAKDGIFNLVTFKGYFLIRNLPSK